MVHPNVLFNLREIRAFYPKDRLSPAVILFERSTVSV